MQPALTSGKTLSIIWPGGLRKRRRGGESDYHHASGEVSDETEVHYDERRLGRLDDGVDGLLDNDDGWRGGVSREKQQAHWRSC